MGENAEYSCGTTETPSSTLKCSPGQTCCVPDNCSTHDGYVLANHYTDEKTKCGQDTTDIIKTADANGTNGKICCKSIEVAREAVKEPSELGSLIHVLENTFGGDKMVKKQTYKMLQQK